MKLRLNLKYFFFILIIFLGSLLVADKSVYAAKKLATVTSVKGKVEVQKVRSSKWVRVKKGMSLTEGDKIRTKARSQVVIKWADGSMVKLSSYTNFAINKAYLDEKSGSETTNLQLWIGKVYSRVKKVLSPGSSFEIQTPSAIAGVRSTIWSTKVIAGGETEVTTYEGQVWVSAKGVTVSVVAGQKTVIEPNQPPKPPEEMTEEEKEEWEAQEDIIKVEEVVEEEAITITIESPSEGAEVEEEKIKVSGITQAYATVSIDGVTGVADASGRFTMEVLLTEGENVLTITATSTTGKTASKTLRLKYTPTEEDTVPPQLTITFPRDHFITNKPQIMVTGVSEKDAQVMINGELIPVDAQGGFKKPIVLFEGENIIKVEAKDTAGNSTISVVRVILDTIPPFLNINEPPDKYLATHPDLSIFGFTEKKTKVKIQGEEITVNIDGSFSKKMILREGNNTIKIEAIDLAGNITIVTKNVYYDGQPPYLTVQEPPDNYVTHHPSVLVIGFTEPGSRVFISQKEVYVDPAGVFKQNVSLKEGPNGITITSVDKAGNKASIVKRVVYTDIPPPPP